MTLARQADGFNTADRSRIVDRIEIPDSGTAILREMEKTVSTAAGKAANRLSCQERMEDGMTWNTQDVLS